MEKNDKKLTEQEKIGGLNKLIYGMLRIEPLIEFKEPKSEIEHEQFHALAQMYANRGYRSYLENAVNRSIKAAVLTSDDMVSMAYNKARVVLLKELLNISKKAFEDMSKLKKNEQGKKSNEGV